MDLSRRSLLRVGAGGVAVLAVGGTALSAAAPSPRDPATPLRALSPRAFAILSAVADRICPGGEGLPSASDLRVAESIDALLTAAHPALVGELHQVLYLLENPVAGWLIDGRRGRFTYADAAEQERILLAWRDHPRTLMRTAFFALRDLVSPTYWSNPALWPALGYPGPPNYGNRSTP